VVGLLVEVVAEIIIHQVLLVHFRAVLVEVELVSLVMLMHHQELNLLVVVEVQQEILEDLEVVDLELPLFATKSHN
jgi:hypothetical protein